MQLGRYSGSVGNYIDLTEVCEWFLGRDGKKGG